MLFRLTVSDTNVATLSQRELAGLENIGLTAFYGWHLVVAARGLLALIANDQRLSSRARAAYNVALSKSAESDAIERSIERHIEINTTCLEPRQKGIGWEVPLSIMSEGFVLSKLMILAENATDATFYAELAHWYGWHTRFPSLAFSAEPAGGGGSTTNAELTRCLTNHQRFVLCVVDSDRKYPNGPVGGTAKDCQDELATERWHAKLQVLNAREIENILPESWLRQTQTGAQNSETLDELRFFEEKGMSFFRRHADLKTGATSCQLSNAADAEVRKHALADLKQVSGTRPEAKACLEGKCKVNQPCISIAALGNTLVTQIVDWLKRARAEHTKAATADPELQPLAKIVFEWGVAAPKMRI